MMFFRRFRIIKTGRPEPRWVNRFSWAVTGLTLFTLLLVILIHGYRLELFGIGNLLLRLFAVVTALLTVTEIFIVRLVLLVPETSQVIAWVRLGFGLLLLLGIFLSGLVIPTLLLYQVIFIARRLSRSGVILYFAGQVRNRAVLFLILSFAALIALGTLFLTFPAATTDHRGAPFVDALFTATSATCVTGLIVRDTGTYFSRFGQLVILVLIQLGGLGIMTFSTSIAVLLGHRLAPGERRFVSEMVETPRDIDIARTIRYILLFTLIAETLGGITLFFRFLSDFSTPALALYNALFHSISAFCNAGFSLFSDSLIRYRSDPLVNLVFILLIVFGGLGFAVVHELLGRHTLRQNLRTTLRDLSIHSRIVLTTTLLLITTGALLFFFFEYDRTLTNLPLGTKLLASLFQSVTARTAGFNTVPLNGLHPATLFIITLLMFIGASPGGTGGGIKTTTCAILLLALRQQIARREEIVVHGRTISREVVFRALAILVAAGLAVTVVFLLLLILETQPFQELLFETVSAFGTVGLSTGITPTLKTASRLAIILLMYTGRLGPLTLALAMAGARERLPITYPQARIMVG